jgi:hypothetical protein
MTRMISYAALAGLVVAAFALAPASAAPVIGGQAVKRAVPAATDQVQLRRGFAVPGPRLGWRGPGVGWRGPAIGWRGGYYRYGYRPYYGWGWGAAAAAGALAATTWPYYYGDGYYYGAYPGYGYYDYYAPTEGGSCPPCP